MRSSIRASMVEMMWWRLSDRRSNGSILFSERCAFFVKSAASLPAINDFDAALLRVIVCVEKSSSSQSKIWVGSFSSHAND